MLHFPRRLVNRLRRSRNERMGLLFVVAGFAFFWLVVVALDMYVRVSNSVTVIKQ
jgi:hypothetical protein